MREKARYIYIYIEREREQERQCQCEGPVGVIYLRALLTENLYADTSKGKQERKRKRGGFVFK